MLSEPKSGKGFGMWVLLGVGMGLIALIIGQVFPSIIPASSQSTTL